MRRSTIVVLGLVAAASVGLGLLVAQEAGVEARFDAVRSAMADRNYPEAERLAADLVRDQGGTARGQEAAVLGIRAQLLLGKPDEAVRAALAFLDDERNAGSPWREKVRFLLADAHARAKGFQEAARIYRDRVETLAAPDHQRKIAGDYLAIANEAYEGVERKDEFGRPKLVKDFARALMFFQKARSVFDDPATRDVLRHRIADCEVEQGQLDAAVAEWTALLEKDEKSKLRAEATYRLGETLLELGRAEEARRRLREVVDAFPDSPRVPDAILSLGRSFDPQGPSDEEAYRLGVAWWEEFVTKYFGSEKAPDLFFRLAEAYRRHGDGEKAIAMWRRFLERFGENEKAPEAQYLIGEVDLERRDFDQAIAEWKTLLGRWPNHALWAKAQAMIVEADYRKGDVPFGEKRWDDAVTAWKSFLEQHPGEKQAPLVQLRLGDIEKERGRFPDAVAQWRILVEKYPDDPLAPQGWLRIGRALERDLGDQEAALREYEALLKRYPRSAEAGEARRAIEAMRQKLLQVVTKRVYRTDEKPTLNLRLRNVPELKFRFYRLDLEEYFRRKLRVAAVEDVVVAIVKPDEVAKGEHEWTWKPEDYRPYLPVERDVELPLEGPGAWIVTCGESDLTATTLVLRSDLHVVVKQSPNQVFVFVLDERTGEPFAGAKVLLADEKGVFAEGVSGADGTWSFEDEKTARRDVRVLAVHEGHVATTAGIAEGGTVWGYSTKAFLHTDRPLYRPGQTVEFRGIIRKVAGGDYATPAGETVKVWVADPRGTVLYDKELTTSDYGTVSGSVALADEAILGDYVLRARYADRDFQVGFRVMEYRKPEFTASIETAKPTYLTGDTVDATVKLRYTFGGAVPGTQVLYQVLRMPFEFDAEALRRFSWFFADPARDEERRQRALEGMEPVAEGTLVTDASGDAKLSFATEKAEQDRAYVIAVRAQDINREWIADQQTVYVTQRGYFAVVRTDKKVYRPKEMLRVILTTVDARQVPVAAKGEVVVARRRTGETPPGAPNEEKIVRSGANEVFEKVASYPVETGPDGKGLVSLRIERAGEYLVRFEGLDARGGAVLSAVPVDVSGEAEDLAKQAKIVAEQEIYMEGDTARVLVNTPKAPALALLTYEGEKVLGYRIVKLESRSTTLELPMEARFSPNVFLRVAIPADGKLYEDEEEVAVLKFLDVSVEPSATEARPGDAVEVVVRTTDQKGRPVPAEIGLGVVDEAIYALAPDATPDIKPFFYDQRRKNAVVTSSSHAFRYEGTTRATNKDLLLEESRRLGAEAYRAMQEYVRAGKEALERGDTDAAVASFKKALELSPDNYEARSALAAMQDLLRARTKSVARTAAAPERSMDAPAEKAAARPGAPAMEPAADAREDRKLRSRGGGRMNGAADKLAKDDEAEDHNEMESQDAGPSQGFLGRRLGRVVQDRAKGLAAGYVAAAGEAEVVPATLRETFADTARWWPAVRTDGTGQAKVSLTLPDNLTTWRITARGASQATLVGEARATLVARKPLLVRLDTPRFLTQGDRATITSSVHNGTGAEVDVKVDLGAENVGIEGSAATGATIADGAARTFDWRLRADDPGLVKLDARALSSRGSDAMRSGLRVIPYGIPQRDGRSGVVDGEVVEVLERPAEIVPGTLRFVLTLSGDVDASLLEGIAFLERFPYGCVEQTINRFLPAIAARQALQELGIPDEALKSRLDETVERGLGSLYAFQADDGSFGWWRGGSGDPVMTAYALMALERSRLAGFRVDGGSLDRARAAAARLVRGAENREKTYLLYALALGGKADFDQMNAVYRYRDGLEPIGLAMLALAFRESDRAYNAHELVRMLQERAVVEGDRAHWTSGATDRRGAFLSGDVETTATSLLALLRLEPTSPLCDQAARWLESSRRGGGWGTTKATGAAIEALATWQQVRRAARHDFVVEVWWNGELYQKVPVRGGAVAERDRVVLLDEARFRAGRNELKLVRDGSGTFRYALSFECVTPAEAIPAAGNLVTVTRQYVEYVSPLQEKSGEQIPEGYSILRPEARPKETEVRTLERAGSGDRFRVVLEVTARANLDYVIVEDPLPAGVEVVEGQARGPFDHEERRDEKQAFFLSHVKENEKTELSYLVQAIHPGAYRVLPAAAYPMYEPEVFGRTAAARLEVVPESGVVGRRLDAEHMTPDTIYYLAKKDFGEERWEKARAAFALLVRDEKLLDGYHEECLWYLMKCAFALKDARGAVESYEALRERNPRRGVATREEKLALAASYVEIGEHERALAIYRDLADELFVQEAEIAETYRSLGDAYRAQDTLAAIVVRYPDSGRVLAAEWTVARQWFDLPRPEPKAGEKGVPRLGGVPLMLPESLEAFRSFQAHHPDHPEADGADYMAIAALQRMQRLDEAVAEAEAFRRRYPASIYLAKVTYDLCRTYFDKNDFARAREVGQELLTREYRYDRADARTRPSEFRPNVTFLMGQMAHVEGHYAEAVKFYEQVKDRFEDARDALEFFTSTGLKLPESVVFGVDEPASILVEAKNLETIDLKVYEVDLMILFAVRKDLQEINRIDLTGIVPIKEWTAKLAAGQDYRWHEERIPVPADHKGVYLVVAKGGGHDGSTVVIKSDLEIKVQRVDDRVRVYAFHRKTQEPMRDVYVKVGDGAEIRAQGLTDARGVFEARGVQGGASVVAEKDGHYALSR